MFANEAEAAAFGEPLGPVWVIKRGALGCTVEHSGERASHAAVAVERVVDTTGAGDAFAAGFLVGDVERAQAAAARCITLIGALP